MAWFVGFSNPLYCLRASHCVCLCVGVGVLRGEGAGTLVCTTKPKAGPRAGRSGARGLGGPRPSASLPCPAFAAADQGCGKAQHSSSWAMPWAPWEKVVLGHRGSQPWHGSRGGSKHVSWDRNSGSETQSCAVQSPGHVPQSRPLSICCLLVEYRGLPGALQLPWYPRSTLLRDGLTRPLGPAGSQPQAPSAPRAATAHCGVCQVWLPAGLPPREPQGRARLCRQCWQPQLQLFGQP